MKCQQAIAMTEIFLRLTAACNLFAVARLVVTFSKLLYSSFRAQSHVGTAWGAVPTQYPKKSHALNREETIINTAPLSQLH